ncbi:hypothetical protein [Streptomyces sp. NPDC001380]|uniref:hypothetical protein n=1 Tax=Streptomyces sp. NPDC001380 TaxID=3364566 RepID=UPI0036CF123F
MAPPDPPRPPAGDAAPGRPRSRAGLLSEVSTGGPLALTAVLRRADLGDDTAARMPVAALLRALPGMGPLTAHDLLGVARIREDQQVRDLRDDQRGALLQIVGRLVRTAPHGTAPHGTAPHGTAPHGTAPHGTAPT